MIVFNAHVAELLELVERRHIVLFFQHFHEFQENSSSCRIVHGTVMVLQETPNAFATVSSLKPVQVRKKRPRQSHRIEGTVDQRAALKVLHWEIKLTSKDALGNQCPSPDKLEESAALLSTVSAPTTMASLIPVRRSISKGIELRFTNSSILSMISPFLTFTAPISMILFFVGENPVVSASKHHIVPIETLISGIDDHLLHVVHQISLDTVEDLKSIPLSRAWFASGNAWTQPWSVIARPAFPTLRPLYQVLYLGNAIHIAHLRMAVELHCFTGALSTRLEVKSSLLMPTMEPIVSSPSNLSMVVIPLILMKFPSLIAAVASSS